VILAKTVKGYGTGAAAVESQNKTHQIKKLDQDTCGHSVTASTCRFR
jgi:pyruvate dehydrogenase complex dehydrogenase (E1) component